MAAPGADRDLFLQDKGGRIRRHQEDAAGQINTRHFGLI
jgi:hypothetical protein